MSTSALIRVQGIEDVALYVHYDGYPEHMLPWLETFNTNFNKHRSNDPSYKLAQLIRDSVSSSKEFGLDTSLYTGYGIVILEPNQHEYNEDYVYTLMEDNTVQVINT